MVPWCAERILADPLLSSYHHRRRALPGPARVDVPVRTDGPGRQYAAGRLAARMAAHSGRRRTAELVSRQANALWTFVRAPGSSQNLDIRSRLYSFSLLRRRAAP